VDEVALEQAFLEFFGFPLLITIPPLLYTHLSPPHEVCCSPDQAAHYHTLDPKLCASSLSLHLASLGVKELICVSILYKSSYCKELVSYFY
jgi:hypothetical protein